MRRYLHMCIPNINNTLPDIKICIVSYVWHEGGVKKGQYFYHCDIWIITQSRVSPLLVSVRNNDQNKITCIWMPSLNLWHTKSKRSGHVYYTVFPRKA